MKILLFGMNGQLGWELQRALAPLGEVVALDFDSQGALAADFSQPDALAATVRAVAPQLIVNAAAHTAVDRAESEPDLARTINAVAPAVLAREAAALGSWLLHYSTDYVFDGSGDAPWNENSPTGPLNVYGRTKLEGEQAIRASGCRHLILNLGPDEPECLYSVFLAKLISLKKRLDRDGGALALASLTPHAQSVFQAAGVDKFFDTYADQAEATKALKV